MNILRSIKVGAVLAVCAGAILAFRTALPAPSSVAESFDIVGMLQSIHKANSEIGAVNASILTSLSGSLRNAETTERVHARLLRVASLLQLQQESLARLQETTAQQVELSRALQQLAATAVPAAAGVARSAAGQAKSVTAIGDTTRRMAASLGAIGETNTETAGKLVQAEHLSALILNRMP